MLSDKLISLLSNLSKVERNRFRKFLLSPYLNEQPDATRLFELIDEAIRLGEAGEPSLSKTQVWRTLYPDKKFDDAHLRRLSSDLNQLAMRFMLAEARNDDPLGEAIELQKVLEKPHLKKQLTGIERQIQKLFDDTKQQTDEYFLAQFRHSHQIFTRASKVVATIGYGEKLSGADQNLELFYILQKLKHYVAWLQFSGTRATEHIVPLVPGFWEYVEQERFQNQPLIAIYCRISKCFSEPEQEQHFTSLLSDFEQNVDRLTQENLRECYQMAQNYCALKINQGITEYYQTFFNLQKKVVQLGIILEDGELSEAVFKNMITIGLSVGQFAWTEQFINDYYPFLPAGIRENARTFNLANLYAHQKKYDLVIELLSNVEYSDLVYSLGAKLILIRTYYESKESLALGSLMDSFKIFIRRNKLMSKSLKREYLNFLNFLSKLTALNGRQKKQLLVLRQKIADSKYVISKKWLLEKIDEATGPRN
jgi:hypothetical protein